MFKRGTLQEMNDLLNHPKIRPTVTSDIKGHLSLGNFFDPDLKNVALYSILGGLLFANQGDGQYEIHFLFIPGSPGKRLLATARAMLDHMFTQYRACGIQGYPPRDNRAVRLIGSALGFTKISNSDFTDQFGVIRVGYELEAGKWASYQV